MSLMKPELAGIIIPAVVWLVHGDPGALNGMQREWFTKHISCTYIVQNSTMLLLIWDQLY